jgi:hypothetical protein
MAAKTRKGGAAKTTRTPRVGGRATRAVNENIMRTVGRSYIPKTRKPETSRTGIPHAARESAAMSAAAGSSNEEK